jgi:hypothetical protein
VCIYTRTKENFGTILEFEYKYTHPILKKKFMGPSKLDMHDKYKIIFVSPICLIVEITSFISGFMMMDTFYTVAQYKYEADLYYDSKVKKISYKTKVNASFVIEFVKECWFRNKIESNGIAENEEYIRDFVMIQKMKVLEERSKEYYMKEKIRLTELESNTMIESKSKINIVTETTRVNSNYPETNEVYENILYDAEKEKTLTNIQLTTESEKNIRDYNINLSKFLAYSTIIFFIIFTISRILSSISLDYSLLREIILIFILSFNLSILREMYLITNNLQKRIHVLENSNNRKGS